MKPSCLRCNCARRLLLIKGSALCLLCFFCFVFFLQPGGDITAGNIILVNEVLSHPWQPIHRLIRMFVTRWTRFWGLSASVYEIYLWISPWLVLSWVLAYSNHRRRGFQDNGIAKSDINTVNDLICTAWTQNKPAPCSCSSFSFFFCFPINYNLGYNFSKLRYRCFFLTVSGKDC